MTHNPAENRVGEFILKAKNLMRQPLDGLLKSINVFFFFKSMKNMQSSEL